MLRRMIRVFLLDASVFEEVGTDREATMQAFAIVTVVGLLAGISGAIRALLISLGFGALNTAIGFTEGYVGDIVPFTLPTFSPVAGFFSSFFGMNVTWLLWALLTWLFGVYLFKGKTTFGEMMRIIGYSLTPRVIGVFGFVPAVGWIAGLAGWIWATIAAFVGIRQGLQLSAGKSILTMALSLVVVFLVNFFVVNAIFARIF